MMTKLEAFKFINNEMKKTEITRQMCAKTEEAVSVLVSELFLCEQRLTALDDRLDALESLNNDDGK